jgi:uncharacterized SAM-binding protein YcdF (DUF218 family)
MGPFFEVLFDGFRPSNLLVLALVLSLVGVVLRRRWGQRLLGVTTAAAVLITLFPIGTWMLVPLENRFHTPKPMPDHVDGIIVLGGAVRSYWTSVHGQPNLNEHAERMTEGVALARRYPNAALVFTGGNRHVISESDVARMFFEGQGIDMSRVILEDKSHSTYDNAVLTKGLVKPSPGQVWLLVTTAYHMPRSVGAFRRAGWHIVPYPVDYLTAGRIENPIKIDMAGNLDTFDDATRAWLALAAYYLTGKSDALLPGPR